MPAMTVWPVSSSKLVRNVGSCRRSLVSASPSFCLSAAVFGSIDMLMTGSGNVGRSRMIG